MPKKQQSRLSAAIAGANAPKAVPGPDPAQVISAVTETQTAALIDLEEANAKRQEATMEVLADILKKDVTVNVDATEIGKAVGKEIAKIKPPVVNIPPREPVSYRVTDISYSKGRLSGALIEPVRSE